ncbi:MAG: rod shape-determining protein MreC [Minisyncoccia bacterium]|jgi:rod shape-determining protein MreC
MQPRKSWFLGIVIILLLFFIFFMPSLGMRARELLGPRLGGTPSDTAQLAEENESLKAQLAELRVVASELPTSTPDMVRAMVYSHYPLNFKNEMDLNAGSADGVAVGDAVVFEGNFVGLIQEVTAHASVAETIFDSGFKMPVRIGAKGYDALLTGGSYPAVGSIAKTATIVAGDAVYSASAGTPYAMPVGEVGSVTLTSDNLFQEASLDFSYDIGTIQTVEIIKQ